jgi:sugar phosphate isomerase/epimerase
MTMTLAILLILAFPAFSGANDAELRGGNIMSCETYSYRQLLLGDELDVMDVPELYRKEGIKGISFNERFFKGRDDAYIDRLKAAVDKAGRVVTALQVDGNLALADEAERRRQIEHDKESIRIAHRLGAPIIRINTGGTSREENADETEGVRRVIAAFTEMLPLARQLNVKIAIENHGGASKTGDGILQIIKGTDPKWVGVLLDFGNFKPDTIYDEITKLAPYTIGTHVKVQNLNERGDPENYDLARVFDILKAHNYKGALSIEYVGSEGPIEGVRKSRALILKYW